LPETRNKTLEELEQQFQNGDWTALKKEGANKEQRKMAKMRTNKLGPLKEEDLLDKY
jgi:hypothetical protein